ncbi:MAG TPA: TRAP transporter small permease [Burkholderiaceae bacterium]|nr:TRAP transporter small permease [Burkholderiaceae bacterium]
MRRLLDALAMALALLGGGLLLGVALLTAVSVAGRWLVSQPVTGDIELVQLATAASIALFLPYCQLHGSHLVVDFFTARSSGPMQRRLDAVGAVLAGAVFFLMAWRAGVAVAEMRRATETTMVLGIPLWMPYAAMVPGLALAGIVGVTQPLRRPGEARSPT